MFTDIVMPGVDGVQLAKDARALRPGLKVLFGTGYAQKATERGAMHDARILYKPLRQPELLREVEALLGA
jgi:two-component system, cell cycle response regulator CpdR